MNNRIPLWCTVNSCCSFCYSTSSFLNSKFHKMEVHVQSNEFMLEFEYPFDWSFATDSLSEITEITSAEGGLAPFPDSIGHELTASSFGIPLPFDHFCAPWYNFADETPTDATVTSILPSINYSGHDPDIQILEALPLSQAVIAPNTIDDSNIQILPSLPFNQALLAPDAIDTGKCAKSEPFFTQGIRLSETSINFEEKVMNQAEKRVIDDRREIGRERLAHIGYDDIKQYFYMPITEAAKTMNVGLTILKKRCRELGIPRWPHRKMKSLRSLIRNVQKLGMSQTIHDMTNELEMLGRLMEENPEVQLTEKTKKWRQACFKASYKKRRSQLMCHQPSF